MTQTAVLLSPADVAEQLASNEITVLRLIARGQLRATVIPPDKWRMTPDDFYTWVQAGAADYRDLRKTPDFLASNEWQFQATELEKKVIRASEDQRLPDAEVEVEARRRRSPATAQTAAGVAVPAIAELQVTLRRTDAIKAVVDGPVPKLFAVPGRSLPYEKFGDVYLAEKLREQIERQHRAAKRQPADVLMWLYGRGPDAYTGILQEAIRQVATDAISFEERRQYPDRGEGAISAHVVYRLPNSLWANPDRILAVAKTLL